jgi:hypothetical protein
MLISYEKSIARYSHNYYNRKAIIIEKCNNLYPSKIQSNSITIAGTVTH